MDVKKNDSRLRLSVIVDKALDEAVLTREDIRFLLGLTDPQDLAQLYQIARHLRRRHFQDQVFLYGFLYFSTYCRNNCLFCQFRRGNHALKRYRKSPAEILAAARGMALSGVHVIDLTMGEDPIYFNHGQTGFESLVDLVRSVREATGLAVMVSPGLVPDEVLSRLSANGADWYACYQETFNPHLFNELRCNQSFEERLAGKLAAKQCGLLVEEGLLCGAGESLDDIAEAIVAMRSVQADQVRAMTFVPHPGTPLEQMHSISNRRELLTLAILRLVFPQCLIPASLDVDGLSGLKQRLQSGANVVTSLVPPGTGLAGVANATLDIDEARRTPQGIAATLAECGLQVAAHRDYRIWLERQRFTRRDVPQRMAACSSL